MHTVNGHESMVEGKSYRLTDNQKEAVEYEKGPLLIVAGPGSGKTEVMTQRVAYLIKEKGAQPQKILVVTFTNRAADELKDRIQEKVTVDVGDMQVSTIHSFCDHVLTNNIEKTNLRRGFRILDRNQQFLFVYANRKELGLAEVKKGRVGEFVREVISTYAKCTENLVDPDAFVAEVQKTKNSEQNETRSDYLQEWLAIAESYMEYCRLLTEKNMVDFSFLLRHVYDLLDQNQEVLKALQTKYKHILIDEYQDTNRLQDLLLEKIAKPENNICVVGDDDQSIYRFRGATVENFFTFRDKYDRVRPVELTQNFRSTKKIVNASAALIAHNPDTDRITKDLYTKNEQGDDILLIHRDTAMEEAEAVADRVESLRNESAIRDYSDVAVLFRSVRSHAGPYLEAFRMKGIDYVVIGDGKFLERSDVRDLIHLFSFLANAKKWADKFLSCRTLCLSKGAKEAISKYPGDLHALQSEEELKDIGVRKGEDIKKLLIILSTKRKVLDRKHDDILTVFFELLEATGCFRKYDTKGSEDDLLNLALFTSIINDFDDHAQSNNVFYFLRYLSDLGYGAIDEKRAEVEDAARIMTVHQAKGLEFPVVVLGAAMEGRFPLRFRAEKYPLPDSCVEKSCRSTEDIHFIDERKLFYVGMTRAKRLLIIASADKVTKRGSGSSRFVEEVRMDKKTCVSSETCSISCRPEESDRKKGYRERKRLSYSQVDCYLSCPLRYKYLYAYEFKVPQAVFYTFGTALHNTLEDLHNRALRGDGIDKSLVKRLYKENWIPFGNRGRKVEEKHKTAGLGYVMNYYTNHKHDFKSIAAVEELYTFRPEDDDFVISGRVDLLRRKDKNALEIVDFKTHKPPGKSLSAELQLSIYALACDEEQPVKSLCVHYLGEDDCDHFSWNKTKAGETQSLLSEVLRGIRDEDFRPNKGVGCKRCEFRRICTPLRSSGK